MRAFHEDLEENVLHLDKIDSLINARSTRGAEGELIVEAVVSLREVMKCHEGPGFPLYLAGGLVMEERLRDIMGSDMSRFLGLSILALFAQFRGLSGTLLPIVIVLLSLFATLGMAPLFDIPMQMTIQILPSFLLAVGVGDSVHILTIFYQRLSAGDTEEDAIASALRHSGFAVMMTNPTSMGGRRSRSRRLQQPRS